MNDKIGLVEFINRVKQELLEEPYINDGPPLFIIDTVEIEMSVGVVSEGNGKLSLYVLEIGGKYSGEQTQVVKVSLSPILDKDTRLKLIDPNLSRGEREQIVRATIKGVTNSTSLKDMP